MQVPPALLAFAIIAEGERWQRAKTFPYDPAEL